MDTTEKNADKNFEYLNRNEVTPADCKGYFLMELKNRVIRVDVKSSREFRKFGTLRQQLEKLKVHDKRFVDIFKCRTVKQNAYRRKIFFYP